MNCGICCENISTSQYVINCSCNIVCINCMKDYIDVLLNITKELCELWKNKQMIQCPFKNCFLDEEIIYESFNTKLIKNYSLLTRNIVCQIEHDNTKSTIEKQVLIASKDSQISLSNRIILSIKDILTTCICCPWCKNVFYNFTGCLALTCTNCKKHFCGVCLNTHNIDSSRDAHTAVSLHINDLSEEIINEYNFLDSYFISETGWDKWREKIQIDNIIIYLKTIRKEILFENYQQISKIILDEKLLTIKGESRLKNFIFSHDISKLYLVRIPLIFWSIYSSKHNSKLEMVVKNIQLNIEQKKDLGLIIKKNILKNYPLWKPIKINTPGETYEAINYPPEFLPIISNTIEDWGYINRFWNK